MSEAPQPKRSRPAPDEDLPLTLADSSEGSTQPVAGDSAGHSGSAGEAGSGESTTGGFETVLGKLVVQRGLATPEEVELCNAQRRDFAQTDEPRTLGDLLISHGFLTARQLARVRSEVEAKKSTEQIPGYKIKRKIGSGAMATVFLARQLSLDRLVAIKVLPKKLSSNANFIERFYKEGRAAAQLNHPNIVSAYDVGKAGDHHYFVMEYVEGETVYRRIVKAGRIDEAEATGIVLQVAKALQHAHQRGFIHRDLKPKNIMLGRQGAVKLADLGLARAISDKEAAEAEAGRAYGTPYYISPEQIRGEVEIGPAADIYGLGATFYHMVTGKVPYEGKSPSAVMHKHLKCDLTPPDHINPKISAGCGQVIEMMMSKNIQDRYHSAADLLVDLELIDQGLPPHFAHRSLDFSEVTPALAGEPAPPTPVPPQPDRSSGLESPLFMILLIVMIVSLLANAVLLVLLLD
ncbi:MAG: serine/threonine protein kinase [Planctomycetota bacterium]